ncbi:hypothetical protein PDJAM_G00063590 [Pangasius djambal]|uniref:Uncharacterized protein n=1 Tax=Pangasius djambal TaxID=1691987 RepID=A0ACC5YYM5_9TELE|nr:hypothetical protein [Pangasius djambal]
MATQKRPLSKMLCPLPPPAHDFRVGLLHLKNGQRIKPLQAFPQVGELPAVAGLLLYPDKHEKMVTTTEIAFGPKPYAKTEPKKMLKCSLILEGDQSYITTNQEAYRAQALHSDPLMMTRKSPVRLQMETYPGWDISLHSRPLPAQMKEQLSLTEKSPKPCTTTKMASSSVSSVSGR